MEGRISEENSLVSMGVGAGREAEGLPVKAWKFATGHYPTLKNLQLHFGFDRNHSSHRSSMQIRVTHMEQRDTRIGVART